MITDMRFLSVCSGIEAASVAWAPLGWRAHAFSENEPFPCAVLGHHYPDTPNWGDMTKFEDWPDAAIDLLVGGTPCQDFSIAGLRAGLDGERGQLTLVYAAIARKYRPRWLVWENVPGVLSDDSGRGFASLLGLLSGQRVEVPKGGWQTAGVVEGYKSAYGLTWRVLDAQFVRVDGFARAVPQRRRRVFVVGYLGDWRRAAAVLFERDSLSGNPAPRREAGKGVAPTPSARTKGGGGLGTDFDCDGGLIAFGGNNTSGTIDVATAQTAHAGRFDFESETFVAHALRWWLVRRLTVNECESLQGFPRGYTAIPYRGKPAADGPRYKALGNSMAVNVMRWIGGRIALVDAMEVQT